MMRTDLNSALKKGLIRCDRCGRRCRNMDGWSATREQGVIVGCQCPDCQTLEEHAEADIKEATLDYYVDESTGLGYNSPKWGGDEPMSCVRCGRPAPTAADELHRLDGEYRADDAARGDVPRLLGARRCLNAHRRRRFSPLGTG